MHPGPDQFSLPSSFDEGDPELKAVALTIRRLTDVATVRINYFEKHTWRRYHEGEAFHQNAIENLIYREVVQYGKFREVQDVFNHPVYKFMALRMDLPMIRYIGAVPLFTNKNITAGVILMIDNKRNKVPPALEELLVEMAHRISTNVGLVK